MLSVWSDFFFVFSTLIRKLGGFFIRRKMEETEDGKKDILYRSLLQAVSPKSLFVFYRKSWSNKPLLKFS